MDSATIKLYKNISEKRIQNIKDVNYALEFIPRFIKQYGRLLYGGMAIDLALKYIGHEGIYTEDILPDYDFYSPENIIDSLKLAHFLYDAGLTNVGSINGIHLTTRRVRIDKFDFVADISFYPEPYYSCIPTLIAKNGLSIVHPDFQRIDLHRSLTYLYEGAPERENFKNRLEKDVKRFNLLQTNCPPFTLSYEPKKVKIDEGILINCFNIESKLKLKSKLPVGGCISGALALHIICIMADIESPFKYKTDSLTSPDYVEIYVDDYNSIPGTNQTQDIGANIEYYEKTCDIFPEACVDHSNHMIYYYNWGERISATLTKKWGYVVNIHLLSFTYLFKYFTLKQDIYKKCYLKCMELLKLAEGELKNKELESLLNITGSYYGKENINATFIYVERIEQCAILNKTYKPRPEVHFNSAAKIPNVSVSDYVTYRIAGKQIDMIESKSTSCPEK